MGTDLILILCALACSLCATFNVPSPVNLLAAAFSFLLVSMIV